MVTTFTSTIRLLGHLLQVSSPLINQSQVLIFDHGVRLGTHVVRNR